jgi:hypothetical protein
MAGVENLVQLESVIDSLPPEIASVNRDRGFLNSRLRPFVYLPSPEYWNLPDEPIVTPVDERGIIKHDELIEVVKATIKPGYNWFGVQKVSRHHLYFPSKDYSEDVSWIDGERTYSEENFRDLDIHKVSLPIVFENWLHVITLPAIKPEQDVMQNRIDSWRVTKDLFTSVDKLLLWKRRTTNRRYVVAQNDQIDKTTPYGDELTREYLAGILEEHFAGIELHLLELEGIPQEHRLIEITDRPDMLAQYYLMHARKGFINGVNKVVQRSLLQAA